MKDESTLVLKSDKNTDILNEEQKHIIQTERENIILKTVVACIIVIGLVLTVLMFFLIHNENQSTKENVSEYDTQFTKLEHFMNKKTEQELLSTKLNKVNLYNENLDFEICNEGSYTFHSVYVIDEFTFNYNDNLVTIIAELTVDYKFNSGDISLFNQIVNDKNTIIVKPNYKNMITNICLVNFVSDYEFETNTERQALAQRIIEEVHIIYEISDEELNNRLSLFFKEHFFFIKDIYSIAIISKQSEEASG